MSLFRNPRYQISLSSTLLLFCLFYCVFAYLSHVKRRQIEVQKVVRELGGEIWTVDFFDGRAIKPDRIGFIPDCAYLLLPERFNYVYLTSPKVDDDVLAQILKLPGIEGLNISSSTITDKGILMLKEKPGLKEIQLYDIPTVSKAAILQLKASSCSLIQYRDEERPSW